MHPHHRATELWFVLASLAVTLCIACPVSAQLPANDECEGAIAIPGPLPATVSGSTSAATNSAEPPVIDQCGTSHGTPGDVWYRVTGTGNTMTATTCNDGTNYDTKLHVYCGACDSTICVAGNDDGAQGSGCTLPNGNEHESRISWCSSAGTEYLILVHGFGTAAGAFQLDISDDGAACANPVLCAPPSNDECEDAALISGPLPATVAGSTTLATPSPIPPVIDPCGTGHDGANDVWYRVDGTGNTMTATTCNDGTNYDSKLHVYCGTCDSTICVDGDDDGGSGCTLPNGNEHESRISWCSLAGAEYLILVHGFQGAAGTFQLDITDDGQACTGAVTCPLPIGACCTECGCENLTEDGCDAIEGRYQGNGTLCSDNETRTEFFTEFADIPDNDPAGVTLSQNVRGSFDYASLEVELILIHEFQGDLIVRLSHLGTTVTLLSRPGLSDAEPDGNCPGGDSDGYAANHFGSHVFGTVLTLRDGEATPIDCYAGGASEGSQNYLGPASPTEPLSAFIGLPVGGEWTLTVIDAAAGNVGELDNWFLNFIDADICQGDRTRPVLTGCPFPSFELLECPEMPSPPPTVTATDGCEGPVDVLPASSTAGDSCRSEVHRTWTATDSSGNEAECQQNFLIRDTTGPELTCANPIVVTCTGPEGISSSMVDIPTPTATDACDNGVGPIGSTVPETFSPTCGGAPHLVTFSASDSCGNAGSCQVEIHVKGAMCCPGLVDEDLTLMIPNLDLTAQPGHDGGPVTTKAKFDIWNQNEIRFSGLQKCITCWDSTLISLYPMPNLFLGSNIQTEMGRARIDGVAEPQCVGAVATPLLGIITREITFAGCPLPGLRSSRPLTARGTQDAQILYAPIDQRSAGEDALRVGPPENVAGTNRQGALLVWAKVEVKWDFEGNIIRDTFLELTNDGDSEVGFQLYLVNGEAPLDEVRLFGVLIERAHQGWNFTDEQITLTPNEPTYWSANSGAPKGITPFSNLDGGPPLGRPDPDPRNPGGRMVRGFVVGWAVNPAGEEIKYNRLGGRATIVDYAEGSAHEYETWVFRCVAPVADLAEPDGTPGRLLLDGMEYDAAPEKLLTQFFVPGSIGLSHREALNGPNPTR